MEIRLENNRIVIEGNLDETNSSETFDQIIQDINSKATSEPIDLDLSAVPRANSYGILLFLRFLKNSGKRFKYIKAPTWLVEQFNMITQFLVNESFVESLQVPYFCEDDDDEQSVTMVVGKDIPILESYDDFKLGDRQINGKSYEPDIAPERYFSFISAQISAFKHLQV